jgi:hypothetical protein
MRRMRQEHLAVGSWIVIDHGRGRRVRALLPQLRVGRRRLVDIEGTAVEWANRAARILQSDQDLDLLTAQDPDFAAWWAETSAWLAGEERSLRILARTARQMLEAMERLRSRRAALTAWLTELASRTRPADEEGHGPDVVGLRLPALLRAP